MTLTKWLASIPRTVARIVRDENGGETIESVLIIGLIVVICVVAISVFGQTLNDRWNEVIGAL